MMSIKQWSDQDRPREKLLSRGAMSLTDAELLAIFLHTGITGKSAVDLARDLLSHFGSLKGLMQAKLVDFGDIKGIGPAKYVQLQAILEIAKRYFEETLQKNDVMTSPEITKAYLSAQLRAYPYEVFVCLFLDNQHRVIDCCELFFGTIDSTSVYPREILRKVMHYNAAAVIFAHNHPSGCLTPSEADQRITLKLKQALEIFDIRVLDHFIVGDGIPFSFAEHGLL